MLEYHMSFLHNLNMFDDSKAFPSHTEYLGEITITSVLSILPDNRETPDLGLYLPVSRLEYEISWIFTKICHSVVDSTFRP